MKGKKTYSLRALRMEKKMSIQKLAAETGLNFSMIQGLETGRGKGFSIEAKHTLADYFHVQMLDLFPEELDHVEKIVGKHQLQFFMTPMDEVKK